MDDRLEFWRVKTVEQVCGLSKSEIYRRMREGDNQFPPNHSYRNGADNAAKFWASVDVRAWQLAEIGAAPAPAPNWPSLRLGQPAAQAGGFAGLLG